jgi:hypothetical protein
MERKNMSKAKDTARQEAIAQLREWIKPGDTVYTIVRHVSRSGMQRTIGVVLRRVSNRPFIGKIDRTRAADSKSIGVKMNRTAQQSIQDSIYHLRMARDALRAAQCPDTLARVRLALCSALSAARNQEYRDHRSHPVTLRRGTDALRHSLTINGSF